MNTKATTKAKKSSNKKSKTSFAQASDNIIQNELTPVTLLRKQRQYDGKKRDNLSLPNLLEVQINSYNKLLTHGLRDLLDEVSPIQDFSGKKIEMHFLEHSIGNPKHDPSTSKEKNLTYEAPLKVHVQLVNKETGEIKEQDVFLGTVPLMTPRGTFIVNGIERVVVNQIVRAPGVFFSTNSAFPKYNTAKIIPKRGVWLEIETDKKGIVSVKIDRKRKIYITSLLRVFGYDTNEKILDLFKKELKNAPVNYILNTLEKDTAQTVDEAYQAIYKKIRPGDLATPENAKVLIDSMFFDYKKYDFGEVARYKLNKRFEKNIKNVKENHVFQIEDLVAILKHLVRLNEGLEAPDDIDHLSNRRVKSVGELVQSKFRVGLLRTDRIAKDRMTVLELETVTPTQLINSRPITAALREFFASSQLSQFMDQTNPLSELSHKRRMSAMGPGGLSRERASFDVRDVHASHYGRICPIATPEGPNIGLVTHIATFAKINSFGFLETPFKAVKHSVKNNAKALIGHQLNADIEDSKGKVLLKRETTIGEKEAKILEKTKLEEIPVFAFVSDEISYYDAEEEQKLTIAEANSPLNEKKEFTDNRASARKSSVAIMAHIKDVTHIDVSPKQIVSVTTALIPFLEHNDNTRATMGSNMQRQAVSLINPKAPMVGTGMEEITAKSSGQVISAEMAGSVIEADANEVTVLYDNGEKKTYNINVYTRSNQGSCIHQRVKVNTGDKLKAGDIIADGAACENGELALGRNLLVAYMPWEGYNFEDAVVISSKLVQEGFFDSVHIETYTIDIRDTKLGPEVITRDIPNVGEAKLKDLDESGVIRIGAAVKQGDILVGKITPKGETELTAEERLLRAIFGDKARDVKDTSLKMPGGSGGKVVNIKVFAKKSGDELPNGVNQQIHVSVAQTRKISVGDKIAGRHGNKGVISTIVASEDMPHLEDGTPVDIVLNPLGVISRMNIGQILETHLGYAARNLGVKFATPALDGIKTEDIKKYMNQAGLPEDGKVQLINGKTGEAFERKTTVGITYILKLSHLVEDKIHARSVGPYSLVTQQPLGGKAQHGGQRFGEMEVWALEAYGAAHTLQEMLTIKSDDVFGRAKAYESIVKDQEIRKPQTPESFNVLVKELQSLCLNVDLINIEGKDEIGEHEELSHIVEQYSPDELVDDLYKEDDIEIIEEDSDDSKEDNSNDTEKEETVNQYEEAVSEENESTEDESNEESTEEVSEDVIVEEVIEEVKLEDLEPSEEELSELENN